MLLIYLAAAGHVRKINNPVGCLFAWGLCPVSHCEFMGDWPWALIDVLVRNNDGDYVALLIIKF
jgi:hypothetical protein